MKRKILDLLKEHYPDAASELNFKNAYELLVATVLAAQCTDARVNTVTPKLFSLYPNPAALAKADKSELEQIIHSLGFYSTKSANLIAAAKRMVEEYGGEVPRSMDELVTLPGVGRKTASVVLSNAFDIPAFAVDTHVFRVSKRKRRAHQREGTMRLNPPKRLERRASLASPARTARMLRTKAQVRRMLFKRTMSQNRCIEKNSLNAHRV